MAKFSHVIFDVDGTLIDSGTAVCKSLQQLLMETRNQVLPLEECRKYLGIPSRETIKRFGFPNVEETLTNWENKFRALKEFIIPYPDAFHTLNTLFQRGKRLGIVTSRMREEFAYDNNLREWSPMFSHVICAEDTTEHKPNPAPLLAFIDRSGASIEETLYIADTFDDYLAAKGAGVPFALATWSNQNINSNINANFYPKKLIEILDIVE